MQEQDLIPFDETDYVRETIRGMESWEEEILNSEERKEI